MNLTARQMLAAMPVRRFADGGDATNVVPSWEAGASAGRARAIANGNEAGWLAQVKAAADKYLANPGTAAEAYDAMVKSGIGVQDLLDSGISQATISQALSIPTPEAQKQVNALATTAISSTLAQNPTLASEIASRGAPAIYEQARQFVANLQKDGLTDAERQYMQQVASQQGWGYSDIRAAGIDPSILFAPPAAAAPVTPAPVTPAPVFPAPEPYTPVPVYQPLPAQPDIYAPGEPALDTAFRESAPRTPIPGMPGSYEYTPAASLRPATGAGYSWTPPIVTSRPRSLLSPTLLSYTSPSQQFAQTRATQDQALLAAFRNSGLPQNASNFYSWRNRLRSGEFGTGAAFNPNAFQSAFGSWAATQQPAGGATAQGAAAPIGGVTGYSDIAQGLPGTYNVYGESSGMPYAGTLQPVDLRVMPVAKKDGGEVTSEELRAQMDRIGSQPIPSAPAPQTESRSLLQKLLSLDTPQDMTAGETALDIAAGFAPGIGTAQGARDFERARRERDMLGMGLSALSMVPVVGGAVKAARKAGKARQLLDEIPTAAQAPRLPEVGNPVNFVQLRQSGATTADLRQLEQGFREHQSGVQSVQELIDTATRVDPVFQGSVRDVADSVGGTYLSGPVKSEKSIVDKLSRKGGTAAGIPDPIRATILVENNAQAEEAVRQLARQYPVIDEGWQRIPGNNYIDRKLAVQFTGPGGERLLGEIQINTPPMQQAKDSVGHKLYEIERKLIQNYGSRGRMPPQEFILHEQTVQAASDLYRDAATRVDPSILEQIAEKRARGGYIGRSGRL